MPRFQYHLTVTDERHEDADPVLIAIVTAEDDHAGFQKLAELLPDLEWDATEVRCDACGYELDDCNCHLPTCSLCLLKMDTAMPFPCGPNPDGECPMVELVAGKEPQEPVI